MICAFLYANIRYALACSIQIYILQKKHIPGREGGERDYGNREDRVAVYRRVPRDQKSYAGLIGADERRINSESSMLYAGTYIDQDGCRGAFKRLMAAAGEGDIDRIETESISAFANNIGELLTTVCKLRCLRHPVVIHFEEEDVTTGTDDWEHCVCFLIPARRGGHG